MFPGDVPFFSETLPSPPRFPPSTVLSSDYFLVKLTFLKPKESLRQVLAASLSAPNLLRLTASSGGESR